MSPKKNKGYCVYIFGSKKMKRISKRSLESALRKNVDGDLNYVVMGNTRDTDKTAQTICRKLHLPFALVPADFDKFGYNAEHLRNGCALKFFKPSKIIIIHLDPEEESTVKAVLSWARTHGSEIIYIPARKG